MLRSIALATLVLSSIWASAAPVPVVDCDRGQSLNRTLAKMSKFEPCPPEKPQGSLILGRPFSAVAESRLRVSPRHSPFYCRFQ
jgi:hypothetical protein